jgi:hypothetical protein
VSYSYYLNIRGGLFSSGLNSPGIQEDWMPQPPDLNSINPESVKATVEKLNKVKPKKCLQEGF